MEERRAGKFTERLSLVMVTVAALGAFWVLIDPKVTLTVAGQSLSFGGEGFSADLKGAVVSLILIGGWSAVKEYWLGSSAGSTEKGETISRIAESGTPTQIKVPVEVKVVPAVQPTKEIQP